MSPLNQNIPGLFNRQIGARFPGYRQPHDTQNVGQSNIQHAYNQIRHSSQGSSSQNQYGSHGLSSQNQSYIQGVSSHNQNRNHDRPQLQFQQQNLYGLRQQLYATPNCYQQKHSASQIANNSSLGNDNPTNNSL